MAYTKTYTPEQQAEYAEKQKAEMDAMVERINKGVEGVFKSETYKEYLKFAAKFTDYSANNTMLIAMQRPDATLVAAYGKWKQLGRQVEKGQTGISILAPVTYKTNQVLEIDKPATDEFGNKLYNPDGTEKTEKIEKPMTGISFKKVTIFDVSQTTGKELPDPVKELTGDVDTARKEAVFAALKKVTGIDIEFKDIKGGAKGFYSSEQKRIVIQSGMSDAQTLKTAFHETAHSLLHDPKQGVLTAKSPRNEKEVQAESVAFIVAEKFGMDTSEYSFPYIASWSNGKQLEQLKRSLQEIQAAAKKISAEIESELLKLQKRNLSMDDKLADTELNNIQKAEFLIEDCNDRGVEFSQEDTDKILDFAGNNEDISKTVKLVSDMEEIQKQRDSYGYDFTYMNPIDTKDEAIKAFDKGEAVYLLYPDNTEGMAEARSDIENFDGFFGTEKGLSRDVSIEQDSGLIPVSKTVALEMWNKDLDVFIDGVRAESREQIEAAPAEGRFYLSEFQYSAQLDFEKGSQPRNIPQSTEEKAAVAKEATAEHEKKNPNILGNTPYDKLGEKNDLKYYPNQKNRHANNIAKMLEEKGVPFSGVRKGTVTTLTVNKQDIPKYDEIVELVKKSYAENKKVNASATEKPPVQTEIPKEAMQEQHAAEPDFKSVPIYPEVFSAAKASGSIDVWKANKDASKACRDYINSNIHEEYESRNLKGFVQKLEGKFGIDRTMYTLAATIQIKDHDGRFTNEVKGKAAEYPFDDDNQRLNYLTEAHPVMLNHLYEVLIDREKELMLAQPEIEQPKLSSVYDDKFLFSSERLELKDDYRGIPETKYYNSSVNEYFVSEVGWLNNESYDREQKLSGLNAKDFYARVTKINANYIDSTGLTGQIDMTKQEYDLLTDKTYAPENAHALENAKAKLDERRIEAGGIKEKPTELYAVRQMNDRKFAVCSLSADGLVTVVRPHIVTVAEAKKAMLEIFERKKNTVKCELVHPQTLDEKSMELFKNQSKELPDITYRICLNTNKALNDTHFLQKYSKNADDTYRIEGVVCRGDYDKCNAALAETMQPNFRKQFDEPKKKPDFEIYQLKSGDATRDLRFEGYEKLIEHGFKVNFNNYDKVYEGKSSMLPPNSGELASRLEEVYQKFNLDHPDDFKGHSLSVSDVVVMKDKAYYVDSMGFKPLKEFFPLDEKQNRFLTDLTERLQVIASNSVNPQKDNLLAISNEALKLNVNPAIIREASNLVNDERVDKMADAYEERYRMEFTQTEDTPYPEKPKPQKKPKL